jgi:hypothetical protein
MAELLDSFYVGRFTLTQFKDRAVNFYRMLDQYVSVWEIANEVNGEWLGTTADVVAKAKIAYALCSGKPRAVTLYFNQDCWEKADHEMWAWTAHNLSVSTCRRSTLLVSYYEQDCNRLRLTTSQWTSVFARLSAMFPSAKVGFGEMGAPRGQYAGPEAGGHEQVLPHDGCHPGGRAQLHRRVLLVVRSTGPVHPDWSWPVVAPPTPRTLGSMATKKQAAKAGRDAPQGARPHCGPPYCRYQEDHQAQGQVTPAQTRPVGTPLRAWRRTLYDGAQRSSRALQPCEQSRRHPIPRRDP